MRGKFSEALNGISDFYIQVSGTPDAQAESAETHTVGYVIAMKPMIQAGIDLMESEFRAVLAMADAQRLATCRICLDKPHYGKAPIYSVSFSTRNDPDDM